MSRPLVIGIAGGIGSGKSTVARAFADAGCPVYDADAEVTRLYESDDVHREISRWWGPDVIADGAVDRARIAQIIFEDPSQRQRLENLLFPMLIASREAKKRLAAQQGAPAVIIDAPLLFEAGLDAECDVVVFVDTPRPARLERLRARSGWDEPELSRRESAQLPLDAKRRRSDYTVSGEAAPGELRSLVEGLLKTILERHIE